jgi:hypothetical protein
MTSLLFYAQSLDYKIDVFLDKVGIRYPELVRSLQMV